MASAVLSILTPVFNGSAWLEGCLQNVARQMQPGIEHWIADGGSTDGTVTILEEYARHFPHIRWFSEKDQGQSHAMNKVIAAASGTWIGFLNVDDFYADGALASVMRLIAQPEVQNGILVGNLNVLRPDGTLDRVNRPAEMELCALIADRCEWPYNPSAYFYPRALHDRIGLFPVEEHYAMDYDFILKAATAGIPFHYVPETWGNFRLLPEAKTSQHQAGNQSYRRAQELRDYYFEKLNFAQKINVRLLQFQWYLTLKWRRIFG